MVGRGHPECEPEMCCRGLKGDRVKLATAYPPITRGQIIVWGLMANSPFGGMIWQAYHYLVPLRKLGFDVWYVEDTDEYSYDPVTFMPTWEPQANVRLLAKFMDNIGLSERWIVRKPNCTECYGHASYDDLLRLYGQAEAAINLCGAQEPRDAHESVRCRVYVETDPVRNQVAVANGDAKCIEILRHFDHLFTYGENLGDEDCLVPIEEFEWKKTRPPVYLDWWSTDAPPPPGAAMSSIANWKHHGKDVVWQGEAWRWSKHHEFLKFMDLPRYAPLPMELAVGSIDDEDRSQLNIHGWRTRPSDELQCPDAYRGFIQSSLGEFTVAKEQYIKPRSGWFSDRSVCYLAAGRPVVTQDTGFGKRIPTGRGLFAYSNLEQAVAALEVIVDDYSGNMQAAREIAREYFNADSIVADMLRQIDLL